MAQKHCSATNRSGQPCQGWACSGSDYCFAHDPARAKERRQAQRKGGLARHGRVIGTTMGGQAEPVTLRTIADVLSFLEGLATICTGMENSDRKIRAGVAVCNAAIRAIEGGELEDRVNEVLVILKGR